MAFDYSLNYKHLDLRKHPELYRIGKGEQGVLLVEPYKTEILQYWRFKTKEIARASSEKIYELFLEYLKNEDFVGADMSKKFLQMGYTRARRYANHKSGQKYESNPQKKMTKVEEKKAREQTLPQEEDWKDNEKAQAAEIFKEKWYRAKDNALYLTLKQRHLEKYGH